MVTELATQERATQLPPGRAVLGLISTDEDRRWLYRLETDVRLINRFRLHGVTPSYRSYLQLLESPNVLVQYLVLDVNTGARIGLVIAHNVNIESGTASMSFISHPDYPEPGRFFDGVLRFVDSLFSRFPLRKIYGESVEFNFEQFAPGPDRNIDLSGLIAVEAILRNYEFFDGRRWDKYVIAVHRNNWLNYRDVMVQEALANLARNG